MAARLIHLLNQELKEEGVVIDTQDMTDKEIETEYDMTVLDKVDLPSDMASWPTDRLLQQQ